MLKVSPHKGIIRFRKRGPFKILKRVGPLTYKLELPEELSNVYSTFHISNLKKCLSDESLIIPMKELRLDDKLNFVEAPVEIMDREVKQLKQSRIPIVKVTEHLMARSDMDLKIAKLLASVAICQKWGCYKVSALTLWNVHSNCSKAVEKAKDSLSEIKKFNTLVVKILEEQVIRKKSKENVNASQDLSVVSSHVDMMTQITVRDPQVQITTKGRPKEGTRIKSSLEAPKKRRCSYCTELGHYQNACKKEGRRGFTKKKSMRFVARNLENILLSQRLHDAMDKLVIVFGLSLD
ncbi:putative reverse transcriptase domain-containing protein [Tanacetum coccineum]